MSENEWDEKAISLQDHMRKKGVDVLAVGVGADSLLVYMKSRLGIRYVPELWEGVPVKTTVTGPAFPLSAQA